MNDSANASSVIAVYGATGHTGFLVVTELLAMGYDVVIAGRTRTALEALARELPRPVDIRVAPLEDPAGLRAMCLGVRTVVNAAVASKFKGDSIARAAIATGTHYVSIGGSSDGTGSVFNQLGEEAAAAGVALLPATGFIGGIGDLLASVAARGLDRVDDLEIAYGIDGWRPSGLAYSNFLELMGKPMLEYNHSPVSVTHMPRSRLVDFGPPTGKRRVVMWPGAEVLTIPRHVHVRRLRTSITTATIAPKSLGRMLPIVSRVAAFGLRYRATAKMTDKLFASVSRGGHNQILDDPTQYTIVLHLRRGALARTAVVTGHGIYDMTIPIITRIAARTVQPDFDQSGPLAISEVVRPEAFLAGLAEHGLHYRIVDDGPAATNTASIGVNR